MTARTDLGAAITALPGLVDAAVGEAISGQIAADASTLADLQQKYDAEVAMVGSLSADNAALRAQVAQLLAELGQGKPLFGAAVGGNTDPAAFEAKAGGRLGVHRTYFEANGLSNAQKVVAADIAAGRTPWVSFKMPASWADCAAGKQDAWVDQVCTALESYGTKTLLTFHHEPEGDGNFPDWVAMQAHLHPIVQKYKNLLHAIVLTGWNWIVGTDKTYRLDTVWPGACPCDVIAFDAYLYYGTSRSGKWLELGDTYLKPLADFAARKGIRWGVGEFGISKYAASQGVGVTNDGAHWIDRAYTAATDLGGCVALAYFDSALNSVTDWSVEGDPLRLASFARVLAASKS